LARPEPSEFSASAKLGSEVHAALETAFTGEDSVDYLVGLTREYQQLPAAALLQAYLESDRAKQGTPEFVEHEIEFVLGPLIVTCKLDAVFKNEFGYEIIDWKTGAPPVDEADLERRSLQLAVYRVALAELLQQPLERIAAEFFYLSTGQQIKPQRLDGKQQLEEKLSRALMQLSER
jgi:DNA helicase-2/ATP-dependent DNA helicase PcrA